LYEPPQLHLQEPRQAAEAQVWHAFAFSIEALSALKSGQDAGSVEEGDMSKVRESARMEDCTMRFPGVCNFDPSTTVFCHSNRLSDGKGMGMKAKIGAYGCSACHDVLDGRAPRPNGMTYEAMQDLFDEGVKVTQARLQSKGLPIEDDHGKKAMRVAQKLAKGGHTKKSKRKLVSEWAKNMKALIKAGKK
jgi:hypothetical protein